MHATKARRKSAGKSPGEIRAVVHTLVEREQRAIDMWLDQVEQIAKSAKSECSDPHEAEVLRDVLLHVQAVRKRGKHVALAAFRLGLKVQYLNDLPALRVASKARDAFVWRGQTVIGLNEWESEFLRSIGDDDDGSIEPHDRKKRERLNTTLAGQGIAWRIDANNRTRRFWVSAKV